MYSGWISDRSSIEDNCGTSSVLNNFPDNVGRDVTSSIIRSLLVRDKTSIFKTEKDLEWTMDVICYGLTMPLTEIEMIKNCVFIYRDWTTIMSSKPNSSIPSQIHDHKEHYFAIMLKHLSNLFIPRESAATVLQATLCTQIFNHIRSIVQEAKLDKKTSEVILQFYLGISGHLLSVPPYVGGLADQLCEKIIICFINVWLHISCFHFPSPTLWCTLREMMMSWRHHGILVTIWKKLMFVLTSKVLGMLFGPQHPISKSRNAHSQSIVKDDSDVFTLPSQMTDEIAVQCWFRFLHIIGNPVSLSRVQEICGTSYFMQYSLEQGRDPESHHSLKSLPESFSVAMKGVSAMVEMFLGSSQTADRRRYSRSSQLFPRGEWKSASTGTIDTPQKNTAEKIDKSATVPGVRRSDPSRVIKVARDDSDLKSKPLAGNLSADTNCILHLFGAWLFDVCLSGVNEKILQSIGMISCGLKLKCLQLTKEEKEQFGNFPPARKSEFEHGKAEAFSILCHIFCHHATTGQAILPVYLSRFYLSMAVGLCYGETRAGQVLGSILLNCTDILRIDLQGVQVLVPHLLQALEIILPVSEKDHRFLGYPVDFIKLRRSCIQILLSMLCLPLQFLTLNIQGLCREKVPYASEGGNVRVPEITFLSLKHRMTSLLMKAIEVETNPTNTQMLLAGTMLLLEDTMCVEQKNFEYSKMNPGAIPVVLMDQLDGSKGSPKLIHIAKSTSLKPPPPAELCKMKSRSNINISEIGMLGNEHDLLTTKGQFVHMTGLLCQNLMFGFGEEKWRGDLHVTLAGLECLSNMALLDSKFIDQEAAKKALLWACVYIEYQAKKPPPSHSKDLHSIIIAAFNCISMWLVNHSWLLDDQHCLVAVLEVIELGISGSKSKPSSPKKTPALKGDKELKPVSFRVRESAEALLALMMEYLGFFPTPCGPASLSSLLNENQLVENSENPASKEFHYYALDGSVIIALHDDALKGLPDNLPSVSAIIRGPAGKRVCLMQLRHFSREKQSQADLYKLQPERPLGLQHTKKPPKISQQCFPSEVAKVAKTKADLSIPDVNDILDEKQQEVQDQVSALMEIQKEQEEIAQTSRKANSFGIGGCKEDISQKQPSSMDDHMASRLLLSHLGLLSLESVQTSATHHFASLQSLDCADSSMTNTLANLDAFSSRTYDTIYVFFVKKGQTDAMEIMKNKVPSLDNQFFMEFLNSLGWQVNMATHTGWNGDTTTSWRAKQDNFNKTMFYYADLTTEVAIHVPSLNLDKVHRPESVAQDQVDHGITEIPVFEISENSVSRKASDSEVKSVRKHAQFEQTGSVEVKHRAHSSHSETKVVVAWLQDFNDHQHFPVLDLVEINDPQDYTYSANTPVTSRVADKEVVVIYIHPLKTGLFQIMTGAVFGSSLSGPLVDGMVVSRRALGAMVRNTAINICRRRRLEIDNYSPPHVCRKIRIQDIIRRTAKECNAPEFFASMFKP